jgi:hypothetical protein
MCSVYQRAASLLCVLCLFQRQGPYKAGKDATFRGKITYRYCRKPVFPPSDWDGTPALRSARKPKVGEGGSTATKLSCCLVPGAHWGPPLLPWLHR